MCWALLLLSLLITGEPDEWSRAYRGWVPGTQPENVVGVLVLDARTGAPLAGVRVAQYGEDASDAFVEAEFLAETKTDAHGIAHIVWKEAPYDCHWVFQKTGYAVQEEYGSILRDIVEMESGRPFEARLLGPSARRVLVSRSRRCWAVVTAPRCDAR